MPVDRDYPSLAAPARAIAELICEVDAAIAKAAAKGDDDDLVGGRLADIAATLARESGA